MTTSWREELAWAAGFFDGEGNTCLTTHANGNRMVNLSVSQTEPTTLERFRKAVNNVGAIYGPKSQRRENRRSIYQYKAGGFNAAQAVIAMLWQFLSEPKRAQAVKMLAGCTTSNHCRDVARCPQGHAYSGANLYIFDGRRHCRACHRIASQRYEVRNKEKRRTRYVPVGRR